MVVLPGIDEVPEPLQPQPEGSQQWPKLPAQQQPVCLTSIGDLCASLRRGTIPLLRTGCAEAGTLSAARRRKRRHCIRSQPANEVVSHQQAGPTSSEGDAPDLMPSEQRHAIGENVAVEETQPFKDPVSISAAGLQPDAAAKLQRLDSSPAAGDSARTAVAAPRSSCSSEAAMRPPRSPGDRTDSDDEGARRSRSPQETAAPTAVPEGSTAGGQEAEASAGESEAEGQPTGPLGGVAAAACGPDGGADAAGAAQSRSEPKQVSGMLSSLTC